MIKGGFEKGGTSARGMYIRSTSDILPKWKTREVLDIPNLGDILFMIERREI